jgi:hypothetical protein
MGERKASDLLQRATEFWRDPVWSKVIATGILGILASAWAAIHFDW